MAKVIKRNIGPDWTLIGTPHENSMLNTARYDVQFPDGSVKPYPANIIAENILNNVDADGYHSQYLDGILEHSVSDSAVSKENMWTVTKRGNRRMRQTNSGWKFKIRWNDGTLSMLGLY